MTREELLKSDAYWKEFYSIDYYNENRNNFQNDNGQISDAFEAGWDKAKQYYESNKRDIK